MTICIPAYEAASFIDRTLRCASGQTYSRLRILVAIDRSKDHTVDICRSFRIEDRRIELIAHRDRLGWCGNVNSLLERVETPFFFLYFHDDLILPQYSDQLRALLLRRPEAASAHCDLLDFGLVNRFKPGYTYTGSVAERMLTLLLAKERGTPLRSMVRRERVGEDYRLPEEQENSYTGSRVLLMRLMAAGVALRLPQTLYLRWKREGGLTWGWRRLSDETIAHGWRMDLARTFSVVDEKVSSIADRRVLKLALTLQAIRALAGRGQGEDRQLPDVSDLHPDAPAIDFPEDLDRFGPEIATTLRKRIENFKKAKYQMHEART